MRSKEVDDAINIVSNVRTGLMNFNELINEHKDIIDSVEKVLNYISELEKENEKYKNFQLHISGMRSGKELLTRYIKDSILKDKIRDKIKELEEEIEEKHEYGLDLTIIHEHEIDTNGIIAVLKEILEGE